jgi:hypothetical protein
VFKFWRWLNKDGEFGAIPSLDSVSSDFSAAEHAYALFMRIVFTLTEAALVGVACMSFPLYIWLFMTVLAFPSPFEFICALATTFTMFMLLRKARAVARTAVFDAIRRRGAARQASEIPRDNVALDSAAGASGSPMAVSVDVDHDGPAHARK